MILLFALVLTFVLLNEFALMKDLATRLSIKLGHFTSTASILPKLTKKHNPICKSEWISNTTE